MPFDFADQAAATKSLKRIASLMQRAGQPVVQTAYSAKLRRTSGVSFREAMLTLASGQTVTLRITQSGDIAQVLLNGSLIPIHKQTDPSLAIGEIAGAAESNQSKFQKAQARIKAELPAGIKTAAPRMVDALVARSAYLDGEIAERQQTIADLTAKLGSPVLDEVGESTTVVVDGLPTTEQVDAAAAANESLAQMVDTEVRAVVSLPKSAESDSPETITVETNGSVEPADTSGDPVIPDGGQAEEVADPVVVMDDAKALAASIIGGEVLDSVGMDAAVATLQIALGVVETNHPINVAAGNTDQAALEAESAESFRKAIAMLDEVKVTIGLPKPADDDNSLQVTESVDGSIEAGLPKQGADEKVLDETVSDPNPRPANGETTEDLVDKAHENTEGFVPEEPEVPGDKDQLRNPIA